MPLPFIPGHEFSGEIVEIGKDNPHFFNRGDRVLVMNDLQDPNGGLVTEAVVKNRDVWTVPQSVPLREMARSRDGTANLRPEGELRFGAHKAVSMTNNNYTKHSGGTRR